MDLKIEKLRTASVRACGRGSQEKFLNLVLGLPHGVLAMSQEIPGLVETSNNVATVEWSAKRAKIGLSSRSSILTSLQATRDMLRALADLARVDIEQPKGYPSWTPDLKSPLLQTMRGIHRDLFGKEAELKAVHAGLECGLIGEKFPGMDMISFGPDLEHPHSPDERVRMKSVENFWTLLKTTLQKLSESPKVS
jgi:dipeptidase D